MVFTSGTQIKIPCLLLSTAGAPVTGATVLYTTYNPSNSVLDSALTCTEIGIGLYEATTTPNAVGTWKIEFTCAAQNFYDAKGYYVGAGLEATIVTNTTKPAADATANSVFADVIGDKTDAAQQTVGTTRSLMAYVKALLTNYTTTRAGYLDNLSAGAVATAASITTIDPYFDVPTADSSANVLMRDVVGNKSDAQVSTVGTTASLAAYIKGMLTLWTSTKAGYLDAAISSRGTSTLATSDLTAQDAVSTADSTGVTDIQDVIGNKSDTANQTIGTTSSLMRYVKALLTNLTSTRAGYLDNLSAGAMATAASITTIDAYFDVPAADAVTNAQERDVVGNKTDAQVSTVGTTVSLMAYVKGMLTLWTSTRAGYLDAAITGRQASWGAVAGTKTNIDNTITAVTMPAADSTGVAVMADVIGNKSDAAQQTVGTTRSIMAYVKALLTNYTTTRAGYLDNLSAGAVATAASITTIDPYFDVPTADSSTNALMRDAVGNKADAQTLTVGTTTSLMAYMKGLATNWTTTRAGYLDAAITGRQASWGAVAGTKTNIDNTITAVTMPSADSTGVAVMADVIGNKSDTVNQTVGTTSSIMRYVKALLTNLTSTRAGYLDNLSAGAVATASALTTVDGYFDVPTADAATNTVERDVVGNKTDAAVTTVGTTKSIMAYVKGLTNSVAGLGGAELYSGTFTTSSATVPADTGLAAYATNYWNGCIIVPQTGTVAKQARLIDTFTTTTGVFTLDIAFTAVPGLVAYKIYAFQIASAPTADSTDTAYASEVIGSKSDTLNQTVGTTSSLMRYVKALLTNCTSTRLGYLDVALSTLATASALTTVDGYFDVTTADSTADTTMRDVIGRKTDTLNQTVGTTSSLMRYIKALLTNCTSTRLGYLDAAISSRGTSTLSTSDFAVSTADSASNTDIQDVIGNKSDTIAGTSIVALAKAIKAKTDTISGSGTTFTAWYANGSLANAATYTFTVNGTAQFGAAVSVSNMDIQLQYNAANWYVLSVNSTYFGGTMIITYNNRVRILNKSGSSATYAIYGTSF